MQTPLLPLIGEAERAGLLHFGEGPELSNCLVFIVELLGKAGSIMHCSHYSLSECIFQAIAR
jgi:hypothetical protein